MAKLIDWSKLSLVPSDFVDKALQNQKGVTIVAGEMLVGNLRSAVSVAVAVAKSHLSELIAKSSFAHERFIITRRNKPVAALVSLEDLRIIEQHEERKGLSSIVGKWKGFDEIAESTEDLHHLRTSRSLLFR